MAEIVEHRTVIYIDEPYSVPMSEAVARSGLSEKEIRRLIAAGHVETSRPYKGSRNYLIIWPTLRAYIDSKRFRDREVS